VRYAFTEMLNNVVDHSCLRAAIPARRSKLSTRDPRFEPCSSTSAGPRAVGPSASRAPRSS
jgi:hypothetical protein